MKKQALSIITIWLVCGVSISRPHSSPSAPHSCFTTLIAAVEVRLVGNATYGRVQIRRQNETWGSICDDHWGSAEAKVVCAMLGYRGPSVALSGSAFGFIWPYQYYLDNVKCLGDEPSIAACQHQGWRNENCFGWEHAGVMCSNDTKPTLPPGESRP